MKKKSAFAQIQLLHIPPLVSKSAVPSDLSTVVPTQLAPSCVRVEQLSAEAGAENSMSPFFLQLSQLSPECLAAYGNGIKMQSRLYACHSFSALGGLQCVKQTQDKVCAQMGR